MRIIVCINCGNKNKISGRLKGRTCKQCGAPLDKQTKLNVPKTQETTITEQSPKVEERVIEKVVERIIVQPQVGEFKQYGVLCLQCKSITPFGNKRCQKCNNKLKISPRTTVYYNGIVEAIQCPECGNYTDYKGFKCKNCNKKLKF